MNNYQKAIENSNIVSKTDINGIITFVNDEFIKLFEYEKDELIGKNHNIIRHPDTPKESFKTLWETILNKKVHKATVKNLSKSKKTIYLNTTIIPILDEFENIIEFIAIRYDITNEVMLQNELEKNQKIIFLQSRMASLGQMLANIAHQWRQPLTELNLTLFNSKKAFINKDEKEFEKLYQSSKNLVFGMSNTIEDFTNFFAPQKQKEKFLLNLSIKETLKILSRIIEDENISIKFDLVKSLEIFGVKNELTQIIVNLINNSKDAFIQKEVEKKEILIKSYKKDDDIFLEYSDNAKGLEKEVFDKIFEPYFTTKHQSSGTGLGLFISKIIIENSFEGEIMYENTNDGLKFTIKFPIKK
ncbi:PAS domain-containing sensor histidine kinase [Arcobacter porcinus]|uniref:histidine kinase n=1 Tax=Arcobacter porcinus TaxID=1935204 RepID=A0ABX2YD36_9BACT|nr:ATP-binding protein [Arcobacter porcinus]OCL82719.1 Sensor protein FixL [Arcobacter porcinus]OCL85191.1 Sensor protein FixL [Arcobacter porcinus]OCL85641.1 Sensor protein FixL [Arcobacter porcinus]OCL92905.1 Sensor protein FixL [Arcobacter porcinus]